MLHGNETLPFCIQQNFLVMWSHFQALRTGVVGCGVAQGLEGRETAADKTAKKMALVSWSIAFTTETDLKMPLFNFERSSDEQVHPSGRVIHKGVNPDIDSYSAFFDNAKLGKTNLEELIRKEVVFFSRAEFLFTLSLFPRAAPMPMFVALPPMCALVGLLNKKPLRNVFVA